MLAMAPSKSPSPASRLLQSAKPETAIASKPAPTKAFQRSAMTAAHCSAVTGITDKREPFCTSGISASAVCCFK